MEVKVVNIGPSSKQAVLASVRVELSSADDVIIIDDARVLRNRQGQLWLAMPAYAVQAGGGRYDYQPAVVLSTRLKRLVEDTVLAAFETWESSRAVKS